MLTAGKPAHPAPFDNPYFFRHVPLGLLLDHANAYGARAFFRLFYVELDLLVFIQRVKSCFDQSRLVEEYLPAVRIVDKSETPVPDQFLYLSGMHNALHFHFA